MFLAFSKFIYSSFYSYFHYHSLHPVSLHDTSDDSLDLMPVDDVLPCIKLPLEKPVIDSWVGVKINRTCTSSKWRKTKQFEVYIYIARVSSTKHRIKF